MKNRLKILVFVTLAVVGLIGMNVLSYGLSGRVRMNAAAQRPFSEQQKHLAGQRLHLQENRVESEIELGEAWRLNSRSEELSAITLDMETEVLDSAELRAEHLEIARKHIRQFVANGELNEEEAATILAALESGNVLVIETEIQAPALSLSTPPPVVEVIITEATEIENGEATIASGNTNDSPSNLRNEDELATVSQEREQLSANLSESVGSIVTRLDRDSNANQDVGQIVIEQGDTEPNLNQGIGQTVAGILIENDQSDNSSASPTVVQTNQQAEPQTSVVTASSVPQNSNEDDEQIEPQVPIVTSNTPPQSPNENNRERVQNERPDEPGRRGGRGPRGDGNNRSSGQNRRGQGRGRT